MKYTDRLIPELKTLQEKREALENIPEKIKILEMRYSALRSSRTDAEPLSGSSISRREDDMIGNIAERDALQGDYEVTEREVNWLESALHTLTDAEQLVLDRAYINRRNGYIDLLCDELGYEKTRVYEIRNHALIKLARTLFGQVKL